MSPKPFALAAVWWLAITPLATAEFRAQVKIEGRPLLTGDLGVEAETLFVTDEAGARHDIDFATLARIDVKVPRLPIGVGALGSGDLPEPWQHKAVGDLPHGGLAMAKADKAVIQTSSPERGAAFDAFYMAYRPLPDGDAQITARVDRIDSYEETTKAGIMLRDGTTDEARNVFLALSHREPATFRNWKRYGGSTKVDRRGTIRPGKWLRLERVGGRVAGYVSEDSGFWREIGSTEDKFEGQVYACLVAQGKKPRRRWSATFQNIDVTPISVSGPVRRMQPRIRLADGNVFHSPIASATDKLLRLAGDNAGKVLPVASVATIEFYRPIAHNRRDLLEGAKPGVLLPGGDFLESQFVSIEDKSLTALSPLFGKKSFDLDAEVDALVLRPSKESPPPGRFVVETWSGTELSGSELRAADGAVFIKTPRLRDQKIPLEQLRRIRSEEALAGSD